MYRMDSEKLAEVTRILNQETDPAVTEEIVEAHVCGEWREGEDHQDWLDIEIDALIVLPAEGSTSAEKAAHYYAEEERLYAASAGESDARRREVLTEAAYEAGGRAARHHFYPER